MINYLQLYKTDIMLLSIILFISVIIRIIFLDIFPPNITGDEVTNLSDIYRILFT